MSYLIEKNGERQHVNEFEEGYKADGWKIIAEGKAAKPKDHHDWVDGKWVKNKDKEAKHLAHAKKHATSRAELYEMIEALTLRVEALEK